MAEMQKDFFADTALIGIASALPAYRFCWMLNRRLNMNFVRDPDSDITQQPSSEITLFYPIYKHYGHQNGYHYYIYKLKSDQDTLLPEARQLDYLWMIQSNTPDADAANIIQYLRDIPDIQLAQMLQPDKLKNLNNLIV
jgi:hypothetical protein